MELEPVGAEIKGDARVAANYPGVVAGSGDERLSWANVNFGSASRADAHPTRDHVSDVLVRLLSGERLDVLRPPPTRSVDAPTDRDVSQVNGPSFTVV